jgi:hypothetical protein
MKPKVKKEIMKFAGIMDSEEAEDLLKLVKKVRKRARIRNCR